MTLTNAIELLIAIAGLVVVCIWWAGLIEAEPPATAAERRFWPDDVVKDDGEYND